MKKKKYLIISLLGVIAILVAGGATVCYYLFSEPFRINQTVYIDIDRDDTQDSVYFKIEKAANPLRMTGFRELARYYDYPGKIRTGHYPIHPNDRMYQTFLRISRGHQEPVKLSFNNVRTRGQLARCLSNQLMLDSAEIATKLYDSVYCAKLGYREETIIALFIPNTYEIYWDIPVDKLFQRMQKEHDTFWNPERLAKAQAIGLTPIEVATLASIVEEETNDNQEKPMVAGLYINRLHKGMFLQADPTVKYALQDFSLKRIYGNHLEIDSPYNTYKYQGLPPGPIRVPSIRGIDSVLNYTKHNYIYMCAKEDFSGTHNFASNFAQHQANARKYWNALNKRKIF